jgi:hypothetical protein
MKPDFMHERGRTWSTGVLIAAIAGLTALAYWRPWSSVPTEVRLRARLDSYTKARQGADWSALYRLADPVERQSVTYEAFLKFYGQEVTKVRALDVRAVRVDAATGQATTDVVLDLELVPERLPPTFRRNLKIEDKNSLKSRTELALEWVWRDGDWYFHLDRVVTTGRDGEGRVAAPTANGR